MCEKKISFGFTSIALKKVNRFQAKHTEPPKSIDLIDCLEGQTIKIKDAIIEEKKLLVIPIQSDDKNLIERVIAAKILKQRSKKPNEIEVEDNRPESELTLDELAARQLIREARDNIETDSFKNGTTRVRIVPAVEDTLILEGSKEPTLHDYENVPINDFGLAMLRGMGWSEKTGIGKEKKSVPVAIPELRPKGMGLGAYKMIQDETPKTVAVDKDGKELSLVKGACAKIVAGKEKGLYCKVEGLDEEGGRIIVKMAIRGTTLSVNEFMLCPITQEEYSASGRILNNSKYRDYQERGVLSSGQVNATQDDKIKIETKKEHERIKKSRSPDIIKNQDKYNERKFKSHERSSEHDRRHVKKERDKSRSLERQQVKKYGRNRSYKSRSRSPSYRRSDQNKAVQSSSKHRSRSNSYDKYDTRRGDCKKQQSRESRSSSLDLPRKDSSKSYKNERSKSSRSPSYDYSKKDKRKSKHGRSSSSSSFEARSANTKDRYKSISNKPNKSVDKSERKISFSGSDSVSDYESKKNVKKDKKEKKHRKDRTKKTSTNKHKHKHDDNSSSDDDQIKTKKSHVTKRNNDSSESDCADDDANKKKRSKR